jgi:hypothetical protein
MNTVSGNLRSLSAAANTSESETAHLVARARVMMVISALTTLLAIAAVVVVIGYRVFNTRTGPIVEATLTIPQGARVIATLATATSISITLDIDGKTEVRIYDRKTMQQTGRLHFAIEQP